MRLARLLISIALLAALKAVARAERGGEQHAAPDEPPVRHAPCPDTVACAFRQRRREERLESVRLKILSLLRLTHAPNVSLALIQQRLPRAPPVQTILDQYDVADDDGKRGSVLQELEDEDEEHATTETVMSMASEPDPVVQIDHKPKCCFFSFSPKIHVSRIVRAQLWVYLRPPNEATTVFLQLSRLMPVTDGRRQVRIRSLKIDVNAGTKSWQSIDVKQVLAVWLRQPETNWGIEINAFDTKGNDLAITSAEPGEEGLLPFLEVKISESPKRSRRESGLDCDENSSETRCCRYPLTVDFEDFGWDWIIAPKRYKANYCSGECDSVHLQRFPTAKLINTPSPRLTAGPCCTPTKMSPINMLYFNEKEQIIYGKIPSMVVDRCGCS